MSHVVEPLSSEQSGIRAPPSFAGSVVAVGPGSSPFGGGLQAIRNSEPAPLLSEEQRQAAIAQATARRNAN
eukprot:5854880-Alexandrium_andersonii.AAC.1